MDTLTKTLSTLAILVALVLFPAMTILAGELDSPAAPTNTGSAMYTLEDIYKRLNEGTTGSKRSGAFDEPATGPTAGTGKTLDEVMDKAPTLDDATGAVVGDVLSGKKFWGLRSGAWGLLTGTMPTQTLSDANDTVAAGYYEGTTLSAVDTDLVSTNIRSGQTIFGVSGDANVVNTSTGDAVAGDMRTGKKAYVNGTLVTGNVTAGANVTGADGDKSITIPAGIYAGTETATANDADLVAGNIKAGANIFGVAGNVVQASGAATDADVRFGVTYSNASGSSTGTMPTQTLQTLSDANDTVSAGYYAATTLSAVDADLASTNIKSGVTIFGVAGSVVGATGDAVATDVLSGKTFSNASGASTGTMPNRGAVSITPGTGQQTIEAGYHSGSGSVAGDADLVSTNILSGVNIFNVAGDPNVVNTSSGDAVAGDIRTGKKAWVDGEEITGTLEPGAGSTGVPKTGQTASYDTRDDGALRQGVAWPNPRFTDNNNGTVTDNLTGLIWLKNANCFEGRNWTTALADANGLANGACGLTDASSAGDWSLPNVLQLISLIAWGYAHPALPNTNGTARWDKNNPNPFSNVQWEEGGYWSGTTFEGGAGTAWNVNLMHGVVKGDDKTNTNYVWPVRAGE